MKLAIRTWAKALGIIIALALLLGAAGSQAQSDPPSRIGRVSDSAGQLALSNQTTQSSWADIGVNYPVTSGDDLWSGANGRAEIDFGDGFIRLASETSLHVSRLDDRNVELLLASGRMILRLRNFDPSEYVSIQTGNARIELRRVGTYRVDVNRDRSVTVLVVREGEASIHLPDGNPVILAGQTGTVSGGEYPAFSLRSGFYTDSFDGWSEARDRRYEYPRGTQYVSQQMIGWRELDDYGTWSSHTSYGMVWYPTSVMVGWAPYRHGRWAWVDPWGWTWVDQAPWGFAPFHYGRWVWVSGRWGWAPGPYIVRPVYAPALVTFIGGSGWSFSVGAPVYGWVPLGWNDPYRPYYNCSVNYIHTVNRPYVTNYAEVLAKPPYPVSSYANARVPGAVTSVSGAAFTGGRMVSENLVSVPRNQLNAAPVMSGAPSVKPAMLAHPVTAVSVPPASSLFKPATGPREATGAVVQGAGTPAARTQLPPAGNAAVGVREARPAAAPVMAAPPAGSTQASGGPVRTYSAPASAGPREAAPMQRVPMPPAYSAPPSAAGSGGAPVRNFSEERAVAPGSGAGKPHNGEARHVAPPAAGAPFTPPVQHALPMEKPVHINAEARAERRAERQAEHAGRIEEGPRLK